MSETNKLLLRTTLLAARRAIAPADRQRWDAAICGHVLEWWETHSVPVLGVYWPMRGEPDLRPAYEALAARGVRLGLPMAARKDAPLCFGAWSPGDPLVRDGMGVSVPLDSVACLVPDALMVPCVGFNADRFRLGYGGGFYDRTLAGAVRPLAVGIAYSCLAVEFGVDGHDVAMDWIATEVEFLSVARGSSPT